MFVTVLATVIEKVVKVRTIILMAIGSGHHRGGSRFANSMCLKGLVPPFCSFIRFALQLCTSFKQKGTLALEILNPKA